MQPAFPKYLAQSRTEEARRLTRLDLARWMASRDNPLTARTFVNRLWKQFFGLGLSKTLDDLGSQGDWPVNPELLDFLACELMDSGRNVKHVVRLLVSSQTYRQASTAGTGAAAGGASARSAEGVWVLTATLGKPGPGRSPAWRPEDGMISGRSDVRCEHAMVFRR